MKIIGWTSFDSDCQGICVEDKEVLLDALNTTIRDICDNGYVFSGETHQKGYPCVPVFDNGKCLRCSMRGWATIMSFAHTGNGKSYMSYYMDQFISDEILPEEEVSEDAFVIDSEIKGFPYYYSNQDVQMVAESVSMGMQVMSFDKVVLELYELIKKDMKG